MLKRNQHYQPLTEGQRYQIQALYCKGFSQREIANDIKVHHSTVSRELKRNRITGKSYCASEATTLANHRRRTAKKHARYHERHRQSIATGLLMGWSPEKIGLRMKLEAPELSLSHSTIYQRIAVDKENGGQLHKKLPRYGKSN